MEVAWAVFQPNVLRISHKKKLISNQLFIEKFRNYLNKQHKNVKFTSKVEENGSLSFVDIKVSHEINKFVTSVYRKAKFNGVFTKLESYIPDI